MNILLFTGMSASGKSSLSKAVAAHYNIPRINVHQLIHQQAENRGYKRIRERLSDLDSVRTLFEEVRVPLMDRIEASRNERGVIVDQVVDSETLRVLRERFPEDSFYIVYVKSNRHDRKYWAQTRDGEEGVADIRIKDKVKNAVGIRYIIEQSDVTVINNSTLEDLWKQLIHHLDATVFREGSVNRIEREA